MRIITKTTFFQLKARPTAGFLVEHDLSGFYLPDTKREFFDLFWGMYTTLKSFFVKRKFHCSSASLNKKV